jgi:hypothetical protein
MGSLLTRIPSQQDGDHYPGARVSADVHLSRATFHLVLWWASWANRAHARSDDGSSARR